MPRSRWVAVILAFLMIVAAAIWISPWLWVLVLAPLAMLQRILATWRRPEPDPELPGGDRFSPEWLAITDSILTRDGYRCKDCGARTGLDVWHEVPLARGGTNKPSNLISLCADCRERRGVSAAAR